MNQDINHNTLKNAVTQLPTYPPPDEIWLAMDKELNLQKGIGQLPEHEPPKLVWESIEANLVKNAESTKPRLFWRKKWRKPRLSTA